MVEGRKWRHMRNKKSKGRELWHKGEKKPKKRE